MRNRIFGGLLCAVLVITLAAPSIAAEKSSVKNRAKSVSRHVLNNLASAGGEELLKQFKIANPELAGGLDIMFPVSEGVHGINYKKIENIIVKQIAIANDTQTCLEVEKGDSAALLLDLDDAINDSRIIINYNTGPLKKSAALDKVGEKSDALEAHSTRIHEDCINVGYNYKTAYAKYLLLTDRAIMGRSFVLANLKNIGQSNYRAGLEQAAQEILINRINAGIARTTKIVREVVLASIDPSGAKTVKQDWPPYGFTCTPNMDGKLLVCPDRKLGYVFCGREWIEGFLTGPNGYKTPSGGCNTGALFNKLHGPINAIQTCEKNKDWDCNNKVDSVAFRQLRPWYHRPYKTTRQYQVKWLALKRCTEEPNTCTETAYGKWISNETIIDPRCTVRNKASQSDYLGPNHPLCLPG